MINMIKEEFNSAPHKFKKEFIFSFVGSLFLLFGVALLVYWSLIDVNPPIVPISVDTFDTQGNATSAFKRGDTMVIRRDSCVTDGGPALYTRTLIHKAQKLIYFMPSGYVNLEIGCRKSFNTVQIPIFAELGYYDYIVTVQHVNNPSTDTVQTLPVPTIEVVP